MQYLWQYYLLIGIIILQGIALCFGSKHGKTVFMWLCFFELAFVAGFRAWHIGNDTLPYIGTFVATINHLDLYRSHMEKGYLLYNQLLSYFTSNPQVILIANALIITGVICKFCRKYSVSILLSILLFVVLQFSGTLNIMRQYLALAIVLLGLSFVIKRQFLAFLCCCAVAATFHRSALLAIGLYFLYPLEFKFRYLIWIGAITLLSFLLLAPIIDQVIAITGHYSGYMGSRLFGEETKLASILKTAIQFSITCFCVLSYKYVCKKSSLKKELLPIPFLLFCSITAFCIQFISIRGTVLERLTMYFSIFNLISIPYFVHCYPKRSRILVAVGMIGCFILYQSITLIYRPDWNHVLPFEFCF